MFCHCRRGLATGVFERRRRRLAKREKETGPSVSGHLLQHSPWSSARARPASWAANKSPTCWQRLRSRSALELHLHVRRDVAGELAAKFNSPNTCCRSGRSAVVWRKKLFKQIGRGRVGRAPRGPLLFLARHLPPVGPLERLIEPAARRNYAQFASRPRRRLLLASSTSCASAGADSRGIERLALDEWAQLARPLSGRASSLADEGDLLLAPSRICCCCF